MPGYNTLTFTIYEELVYTKKMKEIKEQRIIKISS